MFWVHIWFKLDLFRVSRLSRVRSTQLTQSTQRDDSVSSAFDTRRWNIVECTLASQVLETTSSKSYITCFAQEYSGEFITPLFTALHFIKCFRGGKTCTFCKNIQSLEQTQNSYF
ncbi:hypothetical protein Hdeb2414_s0016g00498741 [Helianthus debilis subsp. tardiflorus]